MAKAKSDLRRSIKRWKKKNPGLAVSFDNGYESFKIEGYASVWMR